MRADFCTDAIFFQQYPFAAASVYPRGSVRFASIRDVDPSAAPPEIRTHDGETLFVSAEQAAEFRDSISQHSLAIVRRVDVWDLLLEPFLDTEFDAEHQERTIAILERLGVSCAETSAIRRQLGATMLRYNSLVWDWCHLGLYDVLMASGQGGLLLRLSHAVGLSDRNSFYWQAMELADRGRNG